MSTTDVNNTEEQRKTKRKSLNSWQVRLIKLIFGFNTENDELPKNQCTFDIILVCALIFLPFYFAFYPIKKLFLWIGHFNNDLMNLETEMLYKLHIQRTNEMCNLFYMMFIVFLIVIGGIYTLSSDEESKRALLTVAPIMIGGVIISVFIGQLFTRFRNSMLKKKQYQTKKENKFGKTIVSFFSRLNQIRKVYFCPLIEYEQEDNKSNDNEKE